MGKETALVLAMLRVLILRTRMAPPPATALRNVVKVGVVLKLVLAAVTPRNYICRLIDLREVPQMANHRQCASQCLVRAAASVAAATATALIVVDPKAAVT